VGRGLVHSGISDFLKILYFVKSVDLIVYGVITEEINIISIVSEDVVLDVVFYLSDDELTRLLCEY
jgi:hypothetical protein